MSVMWIWLTHIFFLFIFFSNGRNRKFDIHSTIQYYFSNGKSLHLIMLINSFISWWNLMHHLKTVSNSIHTNHRCFVVFAIKSYSKLRRSFNLNYCHNMENWVHAIALRHIHKLKLQCVKFQWQIYTLYCSTLNICFNSYL